MTDEQIEQHIVMERGGNISRCYINENKIKQPKQLKVEYYKITRDEDKYVLVA